MSLGRTFIRQSKKMRIYATRNRPPGSKGICARISNGRKKITEIREWKAPCNVRGVRGFLGFMNFYRQFIDKFVHIARPLNDLLKKDTPWQWTREENDVFEHLKRLATSEPVLQHANPQLAY